MQIIYLIFWGIYKIIDKFGFLGVMGILIVLVALGFR